MLESNLQLYRWQGKKGVLWSMQLEISGCGATPPFELPLFTGVPLRCSHEEQLENSSSESSEFFPNTPEPGSWKTKTRDFSVNARIVEEYRKRQRHESSLIENPYRSTVRCTISPADRGKYSAKIYPAGEFTVGYVPKKKKAAADKRHDRGVVEGYEFVETDYAVVTQEDQVYFLPWKGKASYALPPKLGLCEELSQRNKYGKKGITGYGRRVVRNVAYMFERDFGKANLLMGTVTIPLFPLAVEKYVCSHWAVLVRRFFEKLKRRYKKFGHDFRYLSVTEIQPGRYKKYKSCGLHLHFLFKKQKSKDGTVWVSEDNFIRNAWYECLKNLLQSMPAEFGELPIFAPPNYRREIIKTNASAYVSKYLSKGGEVVDQVQRELGEEFLPSQWWSTDAASRNQLKSETIVDNGLLAEHLWEECSSAGTEDYLFVKEVFFLDGEKERLAGYCGCIKLDYRKLLLEWKLSFLSREKPG